MAGTETWSASSAWTNEKTSESADAPVAGATAKLSVTGATTLRVNLDTDVAYEAIQINGDDLTVELANAEEQFGRVTSAGRVTANANVTFKYDAFEMAGAPLTVKAGKTVTFDISMLDLKQIFQSQKIDLTGYVTLEEGAQLAIIAPTELVGRTVTAEIDSANHYAVTLTVPEQPFVYENGVWKWGEQEVDFLTVEENLNVPLSIKSDLETAVGGHAYVVEEGATLKATSISNTGSVTVNAGATFDVNGKDNNAIKTILNGGTLANTGNATAYTHVGAYDITFSADSTVCVSNLLHSLGGSWNAINYNLNGYKLTKIGAGEYMIATGTYVGGGTIDIQEGTFTIDAGTIPEGVALDIEVAATATLKFTNGKDKGFHLNGPITVSGSGKIIVDGVTLKDSAPIFTLDDAWTGSVEFVNITMSGDDAVETWFDLNQYGDENTAVKLTGARGFMKTGSEILPEVILANNDKAGIEINNGSSSATIIFRKVSGTGNFIANEAGNTAAQKIAIGDASGLTGQIWMRNNKGITLGSTANIAANNEIAVADGATVTFAGQQWKSSAIKFGDVLTIIGTVGSFVYVDVEPTTYPKKIWLDDGSGKKTLGRLVYDAETGTLKVASGLGFLIMLK